jgi:hypothetical protein
MASRLKLLLSLGAWVAAALGLIYLGTQPNRYLDDFNHVLCGPWG